MKKERPKSIMIQGTGSHVGKSVAVAAICRILKEDGYSVCPFKSQNMALNSHVTASGEEMGRAQAVQAEACGLEPQVYMNPILIKPVADSRAQIIFMGRVVKNMSAVEYDKKKFFYLSRIKEILDDLKKKFDYIVIEGAGSPAEINLLKNDIVNMSVAEISGSNVILAGDVDKGGVFASFYGTVKLLPYKYRKYIKAFLVNKFRGDISLLKPGNDYIAKKLDIPVLGTIPFFKDIYIEEEDSVNIEREESRKNLLVNLRTNNEGGKIIISIIYLPHISNFTDFNAFELDKDVSLVYIRGSRELKNLKPHMIIIPGSKSTISDLLYLRKSGLEEEIKKQYKRGTVVFGICGGFQILGKKITDKFKSESKNAGSINGFGFIDMDTDFRQDKFTRQVEFKINSDLLQHHDFKKISGRLTKKVAGTMKGYEIHMGTSGVRAGSLQKLVPLFRVLTGGSNGMAAYDGFIKFDDSSVKMVIGTYIHGIFDNNGIREFILNVLREKNNIISGDGDGEVMTSYADFRDNQYNRLADIFRKNMDMDLFYSILNNEL